jgi:hypothetical protein
MPIYDKLKAITLKKMMTDYINSVFIDTYYTIIKTPIILANTNIKQVIKENVTQYRYIMPDIMGQLFIILK